MGTLQAASSIMTFKKTFILLAEVATKTFVGSCPSYEGLWFDLIFLLPVVSTGFYAILAITALNIWKFYCHFLVYFNSLL